MGEKSKFTYTLRANSDGTTYHDLPANTEIRREAIFLFSEQEVALEFGQTIHDQLVGNQDYIDCNIVLNISYRTDTGLYMVAYTVTADSKTDPELNIKF